MASERFVVLGLAHVRAQWFREVARWATSAAIPVDFAKVVSVEEVRASLASGRAFSALLVDGTLGGVDRDLIDRAREAGAAVVVIDDGRAGRDWLAIGAARVLPSDFGRDELARVLADHATPIGRGDDVPGVEPLNNVISGFRGSVVAVTGAGGVGTSTIAAALAQGFGDDPHHRDLVVLADLDLDADQAMLHDARDVVPGLLELVDAHRTTQPTAEEVRRLTFAVIERHYHLLLGLRRHRDWTALRPRAFEAAIDGLRRSYRLVVADVGPDVEGENECGSLDVEERNLISRHTLRTADLVLVVGRADMHGVHGQLRIVRELLDFGIDPARIVIVVNEAPKTPRSRAELSRSFADLAHASHPGLPLASPLFLPDRRRLDDALRDGVRLPDQLTRPLVGAVTAALERLAIEPSPVAADSMPIAVQPGSVGSWYEGEELGS